MTFSRCQNKGFEKCKIVFYFAMNGNVRERLTKIIRFTKMIIVFD